MEDILKLQLAFAQLCFFEAQLQGWIGGGRAIAVREMPGYKEFVFPKGSYTVVDRYGTNGEKFTGMTTILVEGQPIWFMSYTGFYRKEDLPFLKDVLKRTYEKREFLGGRGPISAMLGDLVYSNKFEGSFDGGNGEDYLCDSRGVRGCCKYWCTKIERPQ